MLRMLRHNPAHAPQRQGPRVQAFGRERVAVDAGPAQMTLVDAIVVSQSQVPGMQ